jgi:hypothetical protein
MMNMRDMLGESGRTMSNKDMLEMLSNRNIRDILGESGKTISNMDRSMMGMSDNEPRMEDRDQVFSIEADIQNLIKSYNMLVEAQEFDRAQQVADQINMLDVQKRQAQAQNVPQQDEISRILDSISI